MRTRTRSSMTVTGLVAIALAAAACSSGGGTSPGAGSTQTPSLNSGVQGLNPGSGSPHIGGTLNMLGQSDVDYFDYNISYYTIGYLGLRMWVRGLYAYPAVPGKVTTVATDLATAAPVVSDGGKTYTVTIRTGAQWDSSPARQVTGADAILGLKRACNPYKPFGGLADFSSLIVGYQQFCAGFGKVKPTVPAIKSYINSHQIAGVTASGETVAYHLTQPASYFADELTLPPFNPAPIESLNYLPSSAGAAQHTVADGPYKVASYAPTKSIDFVRNPAWKSSSDPVRKAYVDKIHISETGDQTTIQQELQTGTAAASMEWDAFPPVEAEPGLVTKMQHGDTNVNLGPTYSTNPYVVFNTVSSNNKKALAKAAVRQAISYAIDRAHLIQDFNGAILSPPLTHILPDGVNGAQDVPKGFDPFPYSLSKAKAMLKAAGFPNGMTLKFLYRPSSTASAKAFQTLQSDLAKAGIKLVGVGATPSDFYVKYLYGTGVAQRGVWDLALAGWGPDWYGDGATSFFKPLFYGPPSYPAAGGSNYGFYNNPAINSEITKAASLADPAAAATLWAQIDQQVTKDVPIYPITQPLQMNYHASYVHNAVYVPALQNFDPTNVWLSSPF